MNTSRSLHRTVTVGTVAVLAGGAVVLLQPGGAFADGTSHGARSVIFVTNPSLNSAI